MSGILDTYYAGLGNVVLRDALGHPSVFVRHPKQKSSDFDSRLPDHTHPAFIVGETEDQAVLIGKYLSSELTSGGTLYSLPNAHSINAGQDESQSRMRSFGSNVTGLTVADFGLLILMAHANNCSLQDGNVNFNAGKNTGTAWNVGQNVAVGDKRVCDGYQYTCLAAHTTSEALIPYNNPGYWQKGQKVGGTRDNTMAPRYGKSLTGSGPLAWYMLGDIELESDICGNSLQMVAGLCIKSNEILIIPNNRAADPTCNTSANSSEWRAILPHANDDGCDYVAPGTAGTVHYAWLNSKLTLVGRALEASEFTSGNRNTQFNQIAVDSTTIPHTPYILYELGIAPLPGTPVGGNVTIPFDGGTHPARRGASFDNAAHGGGLGRINYEYAFATGIGAFGSRPRARELASS